MDYHKMFVGDYITALEFEGRTPTVTIASVAIVKLASQESGEEQAKGVLHFKEFDRGMVCNRTNGEAIAAMFGPETDAWVGKRISLRAEEVQVGPKKDLGIRVFGSPDITAPVTFELRLPRKKPKKTTMIPTGKPSS